MVTQSRSCLVPRPPPSVGGPASTAAAKRRRAGGHGPGRPTRAEGGCASMTVDLGEVGIWSRELRYTPDRGARAAAAAELEELGYSAIFIPDVGRDGLGAVAELLPPPRRVPLATGILNIWMHDPAAVASGHADLVARFGPRFML